MKVIWSNKAQEHLEFWERSNFSIKKRIEGLINNIVQTPYNGIGKPEALKHQLQGCWSRRIDREHRIIYKVDTAQNHLYIVSCKGHYE